MRKMHFLWYSFPLLSVLALPLHAEWKAPARFDHFNVEDGLPDNSITALLQDSQGFLWFGTRNGVVRYDGVEFEVFKPSLDHPGSLSHRTVSALAEDDDGDIWIGTGDGLNRFDIRSQTFVRPHGESDGLTEDAVTALHVDRQGVLWIGTGASGVFRRSPRSDRFEPLSHDTEEPRRQALQRVHAFAEGADGSIWIAAQGGLCRHDPAGEGLAAYHHDRAVPGSLSSNDVLSVLVDRSGRLWAGTAAGLDRLDDEGSFTHYVHDPLDPRSISHGGVRAIHDNGRGEFWVGTVGSDTSGGLNRFDPGRVSSSRFSRTRKTRTASAASVRSLCLRIDRMCSGWVLLVDSTSSTDPLSGSRASDKTLWTHRACAVSRSLRFKRMKNEIFGSGTWLGGLNRRKRDGRFEHYLHDPDSPHESSR